MIITQVTYGEGGYDPDAPDHNVVSVDEIEVPDPTPQVDDIAQALAALPPDTLAALRAALGL